MTQVALFFRSKISLGIDERELAYSKHLTLVVWLFLLAVQVLQSWLSPLSSDDALFANVALSVATGRGYAVPIMERLYPFHFSISSGPVLILPGAMMMMIFGNAYWVPAMTATLLIQGLLVASFMALQRVPEVRGRLWHTALLVLILWLTFTPGNYTLRPGSRSFLWYSFMGDIPSALWVVLATLVVAGDTQSSTRRVAAGVCFAMAALTKQLTMLASACAAAMICLHVFRTTSRKDAVRCAVQIVLGAAAPLTIWHLYIAASLGLSGYGEWLQSEYGAMSAIALVVGQHTENAVVVQQHPLAKVVMVWRYSGLLATFILYPLAVWVLASVRRPARSGLEIAGVGLVMGGILQILWWVFLSIPMTRYLTPAMIYVTAGLVFALSANRTRSPRLLLALCLLLVCGRLPLSASLVREAGQGHPARGELLHAAGVLENLRRQGYTLLSCGVSFELEYVMPDTRNFHTCENEPPAEASVVAVSYVAGRVAYYTADAHYVRIDQPPRWLQTHCLPVVQSSRFAVWNCGGRPPGTVGRTFPLRSLDPVAADDSRQHPGARREEQWRAPESRQEPPGVNGSEHVAAGVADHEHAQDSTHDPDRSSATRDDTRQCETDEDGQRQTGDPDREGESGHGKKAEPRAQREHERVVERQKVRQRFIGHVDANRCDHQ